MSFFVLIRGATHLIPIKQAPNKHTQLACLEKKKSIVSETVDAFTQPLALYTVLFCCLAHQKGNRNQRLRFFLFISPCVCHPERSEGSQHYHRSQQQGVPTPLPLRFFATLRMTCVSAYLRANTVRPYIWVYVSFVSPHPSRHSPCHLPLKRKAIPS